MKLLFGAIASAAALISAAGILVISSDAAIAAPSYFCTADQGVGFKWDGKRWKNVDFRVDDKYLAKPSTKSERQQGYVVTQMGTPSYDFQCSQFLFEDGTPSNRIICGGLGRGFLLDTKTLRFQELYGMGFIDGIDTPDNTPSLTIGRCAVLDG